MQYIAFSVGKTTHLYVLAYKSVVCRIIICKSIGARDIPDLNRCLNKRPTLGRCSYVSRGRYCLLYYFNYITVLTDDDRKVELLVQVVHHLVNVPVHEYHVEVIEVDVLPGLAREVSMEPADRHVVLRS